MRKKIILGYLILLFGFSAGNLSFAQPEKQPTAEPAQAQPDPGELEKRIAKLENSLQDEKYAKDMADIRADLIESQRDWYAVLMTLLGIAVAGTTIFFTLRFGTAAVSAAKAEIIEQKAAIDSQLLEAGKLNEQAAKLNEQARQLVEEISSHANQARDLIAALQPGEVPTDDEQRETISEVAQKALAKPRRERTLDDYKALVIHAMIQEDWATAERRAQAMTYLFEDADPESIAFALFNRALALGELDQSDEAISTYDELIERFGISDAPTMQEPVARALYNKGVRLGALDRSKEAIAVYDELIARFGTSDVPGLQEPIAKALFNRGFRLGVLGQHDDSITAYDEMIERFGKCDISSLQEQVAMALFNKGVRLGIIEKFEDEIAAYNELIARFGKSDRPTLQEQVAMALVNKGVRLGMLDRFDDEIAAYDELIARFGKSDRPALQEQVAKALINKGITLGTLDLSDDAITVYEELIKCFGKSDLAALQELVARALIYGAGCYARGKNVAASIDALQRWSKKVGTFDCETVANDSDFDAIRHDPEFVAFLTANGCTPPEPPPPPDPA